MLTEADLPRFELDGETFVRPDFAGRGLANVAPTVLRLLAPDAADELDMVAEMIRWGPLNRRVSFADPEFGKAPEAFFWAETMYARLQAAGVKRTFAVNPIGFSGTALTRMLHQHAAYAGFVATSSLGPIVTRLLTESDDRAY